MVKIDILTHHTLGLNTEEELLENASLTYREARNCIEAGVHIMLGLASQGVIPMSNNMVWLVGKDGAKSELFRSVQFKNGTEYQTKTVEESVSHNFPYILRPERPPSQISDEERERNHEIDRGILANELYPLPGRVWKLADGVAKRESGLSDTNVLLRRYSNEFRSEYVLPWENA